MGSTMPELASVCDVIIASVQHERNASVLQALAERGALTVAQAEVHHSCRQIRMVCEAQPIRQVMRNSDGRALRFQTLCDVERDQRLVFDHQDHTSSEGEVSHGSTRESEGQISNSTA
ncbi:MAG: hypothetical protein WAO08_07975 [Hyphomicrobiaceae bacterium]